MKTNQIITREFELSPLELLKKYFTNIIIIDDKSDAIFKDASFKRVIGVTGLKIKAPVILELLKNELISEYILSFDPGSSFIIDMSTGKPGISIFLNNSILVLSLPPEISNIISSILKTVQMWAGKLSSTGEHVIDLKAPSPGPHFNVNLLLGNRINYPGSLQTTPKSVVDRFGRGSFRSHAATQVLATRWDLLQEENGFPVNRQFYLVENNKIIFYSANVNNSNIENSYCIHSQNHSRIIYKTACGLDIERIIFLQPQVDGEPLAVETQRINIKNNSDKNRNIKIIYTGMFGPLLPHALQEDVLYSNVIMQSRLLKDNEGNILAVGNDYYPEECHPDEQFHSMIVHSEAGIKYPDEFCFNYNEFFGTGTIELPQNFSLLSNKLNRKGPGFFAVAASFEIEKLKIISIDNFTGLVSEKSGESYNLESYEKEIKKLILRHENSNEIDNDLNSIKSFLREYSSYIQVKSSDTEFDNYVNKNLPFQVLYQTYVSRSFGQTQKGYREIGFREIQDIFASMYYMVSMGKKDTVKDLIKEWAEKIFEFGYAYHNFFWVGKEPGKWSDDALWFIQAVYRYVSLTNDISILDEEYAVAGTGEKVRRKLLDTIDAVLNYSANISIGTHGLPLLDFADWNDCLKIDNDYIDGPTKEKIYKEQVFNGGKFGEPLKNKFSESIMNAFLLKLAVDQTAELCIAKGNKNLNTKYKALSEKVAERIQSHAWKNDFFARVLINRYDNNEFTYLGAAGDGLSGSQDVPGAYFLNSFSWSILSGCATDRQIEVMVDTLEKYVKTPYGFKLMTPANLDLIAKGTAAGHYYQGDRENGAVFKHASMMASSALLKASKNVIDKSLAKKLSAMAYWMIDLVLPYKSMENPYDLCGNPRFCTQYINSETGENIGPMLSGTSTWLLLCLYSAFGIEYCSDGIIFNPILREEQTELNIFLNTGKSSYAIIIQKPKGFYRIRDNQFVMKIDGKVVESSLVPVFTDKSEHEVSLEFLS